MSVLDQMDHLASLDPKSMRQLIESWPMFVAGAARTVRTLSLPLPRPASCVLVSGMGGSAIGGDVVRAVAASSLKVPMLVVRGYGLPAFTDASSLVVVSSYSGNTEETLYSYEQARAAGAQIVCLTSGGQLASLAGKYGNPLLQLPAGMPPRTALGFSAIMLFGCLTAAGLLPDMSSHFEEAVVVLNGLVTRYGPGTPESKNPAKIIARSLWGNVVGIYASNGLLDPAAVRWRGQMEENAKNLAFHHVLPEMNHNELVGWELPAHVLQQIGVVFLRDRDDHPQNQRRFDLTREIVALKAAAVHEAWTEGESPLARIFSLICLGDFVSFYLACLNEVDPTPVPVIEMLKQKLGS